jgi:hypothetical protein
MGNGSANNERILASSASRFIDKLVVGRESGSEPPGRSTNPPATGQHFDAIDGHTLCSMICEAIP